MRQPSISTGIPTSSAAPFIAASSDGEPLSAWANIAGTTGAPFDAHLTLRGLRTLSANGMPASQCHSRGAVPGAAAVRCRRPLSRPPLRSRSRYCVGSAEWLSRRAAGISDSLIRISVGLEASRPDRRFGARPCCGPVAETGRFLSWCAPSPSDLILCAQLRRASLLSGEPAITVGEFVAVRSFGS